MTLLECSLISQGNGLLCGDPTLERSFQRFPLRILTSKSPTFKQRCQSHVIIHHRALWYQTRADIQTGTRRRTMGVKERTPKAEECRWVCKVREEERRFQNLEPKWWTSGCYLWTHLRDVFWTPLWEASNFWKWLKNRWLLYLMCLPPNITLR